MSNIRIANPARHEAIGEPYGTSLAEAVLGDEDVQMHAMLATQEDARSVSVKVLRKVGTGWQSIVLRRYRSDSGHETLHLTLWREGRVVEVPVERLFADYMEVRDA